MRLTAVDARISEDTARDLRGVRELTERLGEAVTITGRQGPFARTHWREDLTASEAVLRAAGERVGTALRDGDFPLTLASDCSLALGPLRLTSRRPYERCRRAQSMIVSRFAAGGCRT